MYCIHVSLNNKKAISPESDYPSVQAWSYCTEGSMSTPSLETEDSPAVYEATFLNMVHPDIWEKSLSNKI